MTDNHGTRSHSRLDTPRAVAGSEQLAQVFGILRPIHTQQRLRDEILTSMPGRSPLLVQLLHNRGISGTDEVSSFLAADWHANGPALLHLDRVVERILHAIRNDERLVVFGDFDCDGITSCALLTLTLRAMGANVHAYIPKRDDDGRGLNLAAVRDLAEAGTTLIVTTDCGTANDTEIALARQYGIDVIVTDHHPPHGPLAPAYAIINPRQDGDQSSEKDLAGAGVAFRLAEALLAAAPEHALSPSDLLDLVTVGTIADVVPLTAFNWALARAGLQRIRQSPRPGIRALLAMAHIQPEDVVARDISFAIAPRINACGRMGRPHLALDLLLVTDPTEADRLAREIESLNAERQAITDKIVLEARTQATSATADNAHVVVTQGDNWPFGVLGLVAGRLAEEYHRPVFVISRGESECRGSARGPVGIDLGAVLGMRPEIFKRFGGHAQAAGFTLATDALSVFLDYVKSSFTVGDVAAGARADSEPHSTMPVQADCRLPLYRLEPGSSIYADLETLEPYGAGFPEPVFVCLGVRIVGCRRSGVEGRTLRLRLTQGGASREFIWSRQGHRCDALRTVLSSMPLMDVAFSLRKYRRTATGEMEWLAHVEALAPTVP